MDVDKLAQQHENDHPGYILTDWYEAAMPSYKVYLRTLMQVEQPLPAIDRFVLHAMEAKVNTVKDISGIYGLEHAITYDALERLQREGYVTIIGLEGEKKRREVLNITTKGREILRKLVFLRPEEETFTFCIDALTSEYYPDRHLFTGKNATESDWFQVQTYMEVPHYDQVEIVSLRRVWKEVKRSLSQVQQNKELLDVLEVENWHIGYRPMRVLQYVNRSSGDVIVHVYDGVERSSRHEVALLKMEQEGIRALRAEPKRGPEFSKDPVQEIIDPELYQAAVRKAVEIPRIEQNIAKIEQQIEQTQEVAHASITEEDTNQALQNQHLLELEIEHLREQIKDLDEAAPTLQVLSMTEHRPMLLQALRQAKKQVIIVSPWMTPTAVNRELRDLIAEAIARNVTVLIGYGFGESDHQEIRTLKLLQNLQKGKGGKNLQLFRLEDNHAKIIICDVTFMVTTSYNWLSFAGRKDWGNRVEFGTLTRDPKAIQAMMNHLKPMFMAAQDKELKEAQVE
ncbi:MAG: helix-turn-helix transcriptional regulator [Anaerolineales bacterium]|nr:helix-turn-helix transcriptional regulator [Anaerolineales bacterium]